MTWRWFVIGVVAMAACQLDSTPRGTSEFDVQSAVMLESRTGDWFAGRSGGGAGQAPDASHATGTKIESSVMAGQPATADAQAGTSSERPAMTAVGGAAAIAAKAVPEESATAGAGGAQSAPLADSAPDAGSSPQQGAAGHNAPDAGVLIGTGETHSPVDAGVLADAAQDAAAAGDAASADQLSQELLVAVAQLLIRVRVGANPTQAVANLVPLLIAGGVLTPPLLTAALSALDDAGTCNDRAFSASCASICGGLATQCKQCATDASCLSVLQRVCRGQIRVDSCK
jgi:hypothetical protein